MKYHIKITIIALISGLSALVYGHIQEEGSWTNLAILCFVIGIIAYFQNDDNVSPTEQDEKRQQKSSIIKIPFHFIIAIIALLVGIASFVYGYFQEDQSWTNMAVFCFIITVVALIQRDDSVRITWNEKNGTFLVTKRKRTLEFEVSEIKSFKSDQLITPSKYEQEGQSLEHVRIEIEFHQKTPFGKKIRTTIYHSNRYDYEGYKKLKYAFMKLRSDRAKGRVRRS